MIFLKKYIWLILTLLLFLILMIITAPIPFKKIPLPTEQNGTLEDSLEIKNIKISDIISKTFSMSFLFKKYDIILSNNSTKECDRNLIITTKKDSLLALKINEYLKKESDVIEWQQEGNENIEYAINEGEKIFIKDYPISEKIDYKTLGVQRTTSRPTDVNKDGQLYPRQNCKILGAEEFYSNISYFYIKPNLPDWLIGSFILLLASLTFMSSLKEVTTTS